MNIRHELGMRRKADCSTRRPSSSSWQTSKAASSRYLHAECQLHAYVRGSVSSVHASCMYLPTSVLCMYVSVLICMHVRTAAARTCSCGESPLSQFQTEESICHNSTWTYAHEYMSGYITHDELTRTCADVGLRAHFICMHIHE
jgi:hypothetical protein